MSTAATSQGPIDRIAARLAEFSRDPLSFVMWSWPWGTDPRFRLVRLPEPWRTRYGVECGPDWHQCEVLDHVGQALRERNFDGRTPVPPVQVAISSGHGIGKSALVGMLVTWALQTSAHARGILTANTVPQLSSKTWPEVCRWFRSSLAAQFFEVSESGMWIAHKAHAKTWRLDAQTARPENSEAFQGLHNATGRTFYIVDEASGIDERIMEVIEGSLSDGEPLWFMFGNPTRPDGYFARAVFGSLSAQWKSWIIDSRKVQVTNKARIEQLLQRCDGDEDSDFFRVRVRGLPPKQGDDTLVPSHWIEQARKRDARPLPTDPLVAGLDVARSGRAESVCQLRRGKDAKSWPKYAWRLRDAMQLAARCAQIDQEMRAAHTPIAVWFVDGGGVGGPVVDRMRQLGMNVIEVNSGFKASDGQSANLGTQMWCAMRDWLRDGGAIRDDPVLAEQIRMRRYVFDNNMKIRLEPKENLEKRGERSPDHADALALTFAYPVAPMPAPGRGRGNDQAETEFDPLEDD